MTIHLTFIHARSALHAGTGQGVDLIDLPIARERATGIPFLPGSSLKGTLRDAVKQPELRTALFGPETTKASDFASSVQISDQRLLALPVRSMAGTFAWVTCPFVLQRLARDAQDAGVPCDVQPPKTDGHTTALITTTSVLSTVDMVVLEDLDLTPTAEKRADEWAKWIGEHVFATSAPWQDLLLERLCIVHDDVFGFLCETATEVSARVRLKDDTKTVAKGALWYEESLPAESLLYGIATITFTPAALGKNDQTALRDTLATALERPLQLGGKATVGKGMCQITMIPAPQQKDEGGA